MSKHPLTFTNCFPCQTQTCSQEAICISEVFFFFSERGQSPDYPLQEVPLVWGGRCLSEGFLSACDGVGWSGWVRDWQAAPQAALGFTTTATSSKSPGQGPRTFHSQRALIKPSWHTRTRGKKTQLLNTRDGTVSNMTWQNKKGQMDTLARIHEWDLYTAKRYWMGLNFD